MVQLGLFGTYMYAHAHAHDDPRIPCYAHDLAHPNLSLVGIPQPIPFAHPKSSLLPLPLHPPPKLPKGYIIAYYLGIGHQLPRGINYIDLPVVYMYCIANEFGDHPKYGYALNPTRMWAGAFGWALTAQAREEDGPACCGALRASVGWLTLLLPGRSGPRQRCVHLESLHWRRGAA